MKPKHLLQLIFFLSACLLISPALAVYKESHFKKNPQTFSESLNDMGIYYSLKQGSLDILIDQNKALDSIPLMQRMNNMSYQVTQTEINSKPAYYACSVGLFYTVLLIPHLYQTNEQIDYTQVNAYLLSTDLYGNSVKNPIFSFHINRNLYSKINWNDFNFLNLIKITPDFQFSPWYRNELIKGNAA